MTAALTQGNADALLAAAKAGLRAPGGPRRPATIPGLYVLRVPRPVDWHPSAAVRLTRARAAIEGAVGIAWNSDDRAPADAAARLDRYISQHRRKEQEP